MHLTKVAGGLTFPTSVAFDERGRIFVAESGLPFGGATLGGTVRLVLPDGDSEIVGSGFRPPLTGLTFDNGSLYVSEGGYPARIVRLRPDGEVSTVIEGLPGPGNYHTNMAVVGPDGWLYFSQGAMTNTGVVGLDSYELGWLRRLPHAHDTPGFELELTGVNFTTDDPVTRGSTAVTGAFLPFGTPSHSGMQVAPALPCTAAVMRCRLDGTGLELVAWGLRNAFGLAFLPDGKLLALDQGADDRGSRPAGNAPDALFEVVGASWYGWPDYIAGEPITSSCFRPERGPAPSFLIANHASLPSPRKPLHIFEPHCAATKFCVVGDDLYVALFGDERPLTAPEGPSRGRAIVRLSRRDWRLQDQSTGLLERPIDVGFNHPEGALYVLDFGHFEILADRRLDASPGTGALWRVD